MSKLESSETIEATVGSQRHPVRHIGRAVSAEQRVYVLHSERCRADFGKGLTSCPYSRALDLGILPQEWAGFEDMAVALKISKATGRLLPMASKDHQAGDPALAAEQMQYPRRCKWCRSVHDAAKVTIVQRFSDCSTYRCPGCRQLLDDRPERLGGSSLPLEVDRG